MTLARSACGAEAVCRHCYYILAGHPATAERIGDQVSYDLLTAADCAHDADWLTE